MPNHPDITDQVAKIADAFEKHSYDDLRHFAELGAALTRIEKTLEAQGKTLAPIARTFETTNTLGKWLMPFLVAISLMVGIVWGIVQIIRVQNHLY